MKTLLKVHTFILIFLASIGFAHAAPENELDKDARAELNALYESSPAARALGEKAKGILVFPGIRKAAFIVGARILVQFVFRRGVRESDARQKDQDERMDFQQCLHVCSFQGWCGARSPVLKASDAAAVKTALLVSISTVRALVRAVWAFVTSIKVATPLR